MLYPFIIIAIFFFLPAMVICARDINDFLDELKYLNIEIRRARGKKRQFYLRRRRRLWLSLIIPFIKY